LPRVVWHKDDCSFGAIFRPLRAKDGNLLLGKIKRRDFRCLRLWRWRHCLNLHEYTALQPMDRKPVICARLWQRSKRRFKLLNQTLRVGMVIGASLTAVAGPIWENVLSAFLPPADCNVRLLVQAAIVIGHGYSSRLER
jgi:hypothetical protein